METAKKPTGPLTDVMRGVQQPHKLALAPKKARPAVVKWLALAIALTLLIIGGVVYWLVSRSANRTLSEQGLAFSYPKTFSLTDSANKNVIAVLQKTNPTSDITVAKEKGADTGAILAKRNVLDILELNASKSLPQAYKNFQKDGDERLKLDGFDAADYSWHYTGKDGKTIVYAHLFIIPRGHDAYYLTLESVSQRDVSQLASQIKTSLKLP